MYKIKKYVCINFLFMFNNLTVYALKFIKRHNNNKKTIIKSKSLNKILYKISIYEQMI